MLSYLKEDESHYEQNFLNCVSSEYTVVAGTLRQYVLQTNGTNWLLSLKCMYCQENGFPYLNTFSQKITFFTLCAFINGRVLFYYGHIYSFLHVAQREPEV
jgi:hypothetical protein